jgi:hypothetical protein
MVNTGVGYLALRNLTNGRNNIGIGQNAGVNMLKGTDNILIGNVGRPNETGSIRLGTSGNQRRTYVAGIDGVTIADGVSVVIGRDGQLGTITSSARYKKEIKSMDNASAAILQLRPVSFRYKDELDAKGVPQFGLVAEDVARIAPDLVVRDESGQPYTVRYEAVNAMLLNEFLKEHRKVETLEATVTKLAAALEAQAAQIKKITARLESETAGELPVENR